MEWAKWVLGIAGVLLCAAIIASWKLIANKVDKPDLQKAIEELDGDIKAVNVRIDQSLVIIAQAVSKTDLIEKMGSASTRADDKDLRVQRDITELKSDMKSLTEKLIAIDKKLDELPTRVTSLEATRNQNQK